MVLCFLFLFSLLTGCGNKSTSSQQDAGKVEQKADVEKKPETNETKQKVTINFYTWESQEEKNTIFQQFMDENPEIEVKLNIIPDNADKQTKLDVMALGGGDIDIMPMAGNAHFERAENGMLAPLDDFIKKDNIDMEYPIRFIPKRVNLENYWKVWGKSNFPLYYLNSFKISIFIVIGQILTSAVAAYGFARIRFRGRDKIFILYLATLMIPPQVTLLPKYILFRYLGLIDTHAALILPGIFSVFGVFLLRQYFLTIPFDLTEAAKIDGAGHLRIFLQIIMPLSRASIITLVVLAFTWSWNDYQNPLIFISDHMKLTLTVGLQRFQEEFTTNYAVIMAGATTALVPMIVVFIVAQKYFIESFAAAGIKG